MELRNQTSWAQPPQSICSVARLLLSALVCIALFLGQTMPVMAGTSNGGDWIEICGDGGSYLIQINADGVESTKNTKNTGDTGPKDMPDCVHCDTCLVTPFEAQNVQFNQVFLTNLIDFKPITFSITRSVPTERPEQYWSACRGPPIASTKSNMTTRYLTTQSFTSNAVTATTATTATIANTGDLPWV